MHQRCPSTNPFPKPLPGFQSGSALCSSYTPSILWYFTPLIRASIISSRSWIQYRAMTSSKDLRPPQTGSPDPHCCMVLAGIEKGPDKEYLRVVPHILKLLSWTWLRPWVDYIWTIMHIHDFNESDSCHAKIMHSFWNAPSRCRLGLRPRPHWRAYHASTAGIEIWSAVANPGRHRGPWPPSSGGQIFFHI